MIRPALIVTGGALMWLAAPLWIAGYEAHDINPVVCDALGATALLCQIAGGSLWFAAGRPFAEPKRRLQSRGFDRG